MERVWAERSTFGAISSRARDFAIVGGWLLPLCAAIFDLPDL